MADSTGRRLLSAFGWGNVALAALHGIIIFVGAPAYRFFGAGERMARNAERGVWLPAAITAGLTVVFAGFAWMSFQAAGAARPAPTLKYGVAAITAIFLLRGVLVVPQAWFAAQHPGVMPGRYLVFSAIALLMGAIGMRGITLVWREI